MDMQKSKEKEAAKKKKRGVPVGQATATAQGAMEGTARKRFGSPSKSRDREPLSTRARGFVPERVIKDARNSRPKRKGGCVVGQSMADDLKARERDTEREAATRRSRAFVGEFISRDMQRTRERDARKEKLK